MNTEAALKNIAHIENCIYVIRGEPTPSVFHIGVEVGQIAVYVEELKKLITDSINKN